MELTVNNLIKMVIAAIVIVVVVLGVYFIMSSYVIPYFKGIGVGGEEEVGGGIVGEAGVCEGKTSVGSFQIYDPGITALEHNFFFTNKNIPTKIYLSEDGGEIKEARRLGDKTFGRVSGYKIEIYDKYKKGDASILDGALIGGNQICEP